MLTEVMFVYDAFPANVTRAYYRFWNKEFVEARGLKWPLPGDETLENLDFIETRT